LKANALLRGARVFAPSIAAECYAKIIFFLSIITPQHHQTSGQVAAKNSHSVTMAKFHEAIQISVSMFLSYIIKFQNQFLVSLVGSHLPKIAFQLMN
jgi:hypothetical protein